jgi:hypothetical protein
MIDAETLSQGGPRAADVEQRPPLYPAGLHLDKWAAFEDRRNVGLRPSAVCHGCTRRRFGVTTLSKALWIVILAIVALGLLSMLFLAGISPAD